MLRPLGVYLEVVIKPRALRIGLLQNPLTLLKTQDTCLSLELIHQATLESSLDLYDSLRPTHPTPYTYSYASPVNVSPRGHYLCGHVRSALASTQTVTGDATPG